jgi:hypothetical protein
MISLEQGGSGPTLLLKGLAMRSSRRLARCFLVIAAVGLLALAAQAGRDRPPPDADGHRLFRS